MFSIFGDDDPFAMFGGGNPFEEMNQMMSNMRSQMNFPLGMSRGMNPSMNQQMMPMPRHMFPMMMPPMLPMPRTIPSMTDISMRGTGNVSFHSSTTSMVFDGSGQQPRVVQKSSSTNIGPNGVKQTSKSLRDSETGENKLSLGRHIGERSHIKEKSENYKTGEAEETQEFVNLDEDEADKFNEEFNHHMSRGYSEHHQRRTLRHADNRHQPYYNRRRQPAAIEYKQKSISSKHDEASSRRNHELSPSTSKK